MVTVSKMLGHLDPTTTHGIYAHLVEGAEREAVDLLAERLGNALAPDVTR
jgi:hypothetical protein